MDFLLIVIAILGFVVSIVMLVLAARATREQHASDARVATLQAMATGSVLFAPATSDAVELNDEPLYPTIDLPQDPAPWSREKDDQDLALYEFADETALAEGSAASDEPPSGTSDDYAMPAPAYPFVMTVPAAAGTGRVQVSFERARRRSPL